MRALPLLLLAGCAGLPAPTPEALRRLKTSFPPPSSPYVRVHAEVRIDSDRFAGNFHAVLVARTGGDPQVRLQLLPDVGPKVLDVLATRQRIRGWFPQTGEMLDVALPSEARAHPIVFFGLTLLERFADIEGRVLATNGADFTLKPLSPVVEVSGSALPFGLGRETHPRSLTFRWSSAVSWHWSNAPESVRADGFELEAVGWKEQRLDRIDESVFRLELPVDSR